MYSVTLRALESELPWETARPPARLLPTVVSPIPATRNRAAPQIAGVVPASRLAVRPQPLTVATGISEVDALTGGLPRGALTEIFGPASSGRTTLLLSVLAGMTAGEEVCALVDASDAFHPQSAAAAGVELQRLLWIRCGKEVPRFESSASRAEKRETRSRRREAFSRVEQALKAADLLLQAGGFGLVALDLGDIPPLVAHRVPLTSWFRFRRAVENTSTVLLLIGQETCAKTCASLVLRLQPSAVRHQPSGKEIASEIPTHARLLCGLRSNAEVVHARFERHKPPRAAEARFESKALWAG